VTSTHYFALCTKNLLLFAHNWTLVGSKRQDFSLAPPWSLVSTMVVRGNGLGIMWSHLVCLYSRHTHLGVLGGRLALNTEFCVSTHLSPLSSSSFDNIVF